MQKLLIQHCLGRPIALKALRELAGMYISAYLNSSVTGRLILGIHDSRVVQGIPLNGKQRDDMRLAFDAVLAQLDSNVPDLHIAVIQVKPVFGSIRVYFYKEAAYHKRKASKTTRARGADKKSCASSTDVAHKLLFQQNKRFICIPISPRKQEEQAKMKDQKLNVPMLMPMLMMMMMTTTTRIMTTTTLRPTPSKTKRKMIIRRRRRRRSKSSFVTLILLLGKYSCYQSQV